MAIEHWHTWNNNGRSQGHLSPLMQSFQPLVDHEVNRWGASGLPKLVLEAEAKRLAVGAFHTFDPKKAQIQTHVMNRMRGMSNFVATYKGDVRLSLEKVQLADKVSRAEAELKLELGRHPTDEEIARRVGVGQTTIGKLHRFHTAMYSAAEAGGFNQPVREDISHDQIILDYLHHDLPPTHKLVFQHSTGYGGKPILSAGEIAKKLKVSPGRVSQLKTEIASHAKQYSRAVGTLMD